MSKGKGSSAVDMVKRWMALEEALMQGDPANGDGVDRYEFAEQYGGVSYKTIERDLKDFVELGQRIYPYNPSMTAFADDYGGETRRVRVPYAEEGQTRDRWYVRSRYKPLFACNVP
jgi:hypothetical protein